LSREEIPAEAPRPGIQLLRTERNSLTLPPEVPVGLVLFADAYHRLWEPCPMLQRLKGRLSATGWLAVLDREGPDDEPRRLAGHRRRVSSRRVIEDMRQAGFYLQRALPAPTPDRFFLLFCPASPSAR
jgi:hypothetical protein